VKRYATDFPRPRAILSSFLNDGAFLPRSIRLRKSTEIPTSSANCSCVLSDSSRIWRTRESELFLQATQFLRLHRQKVCRNLLRAPPNGITGYLRIGFEVNKASGGSRERIDERDSCVELMKGACAQAFLFTQRGIQSGVESKRTETGRLSCVENASRFSKEGALIPRSIRLRKSTDIFQELGELLLLSFLANLIALRRWPNFSRRLGT